MHIYVNLILSYNEVMKLLSALIIFNNLFSNKKKKTLIKFNFNELIKNNK